MAELPDKERVNMTGELWLDSLHTESGMTYRAAIRSDIEAPKITVEIDAVFAMLRGNGRLPHATVELPVEGAIERRKAQIAKQAHDLREKQIQEANPLRQSRRDRLCIDAETDLDGPDVGASLNTKRDDLSGMTPLEAAEDSKPGLTRASNALSDLVRQRASAAEAGAERKRYQQMITADAVRSLPSEHVDAFLSGLDDDLGRTTPLLFANDESTYRKALKKLSEWQRELGGPV